MLPEDPALAVSRDHDKDTYRPQLVAALVGIAGLSALISVLYLTGSLYMLEVYDRVLPSRSIPTLVGLSAIVAGLYAFQGFFDLMRSRLLVRLAGQKSEVELDLMRRVKKALDPDDMFNPGRGAHCVVAVPVHPEGGAHQ